jgi:hypothetical protein
VRVSTNIEQQLTRTSPRRSVYDRGAAERLGDFQESDDGVIARDRQGKIIGIFPTQTEAINAVAKAAGAA